MPNRNSTRSYPSKSEWAEIGVILVKVDRDQSTDPLIFQFQCLFSPDYTYTTLLQYYVVYILYIPCDLPFVLTMHSEHFFIPKAAIFILEYFSSFSFVLYHMFGEFSNYVPNHENLKRPFLEPKLFIGQMLQNQIDRDT